MKVLVAVAFLLISAVVAAGIDVGHLAGSKSPAYVPLKTPGKVPGVAMVKAKPAAKASTNQKATSTKVDFLTQVQPILASTCYSCHGPDVHKGKLRLDVKDLAFAGGFSGPAIVPGDSKKSYLMQRILGTGDEPRMPLNHAPLTPEQIATIRTWIDQGAQWPDSASTSATKTEQHWAFVKPVHYTPPAVKTPAWVRNPIDNFVLARLEKDGLQPSATADRATLIRRVSLDLTGLPPTPEEVDAFIADKSPNAYEKVVDRLLASPHYGEQWGRHWLDIARYADTNGYEKDRARTIWPYRDWVINSINADMPFDEFTIEQIAGDMLPNATVAQKVATGFHRNTMINEEGGIDVEEFRYKALVDRVQTTATAFLGLTLQCAQCHNHKYDQLSQKEYYQFYAFLNNADEPEVEIPTPEVTAKRAEIQNKIAAIEANYENDFPLGLETLEWQPVKPTDLTSSSGATLKAQEDGSVLATGPVPETDKYTVTVHTNLKDITAFRLETLTDPSLPKNGPGRAGSNGNGNFVISRFKVTAAPLAGGDAKPVSFSSAQADFSQPGFEVTNLIGGKPDKGWAIDDGSGSLNKNRTATLQTGEKVGFDGGTTLTFTIEQNYSKHTLGHFRISAGHKVTTLPEVAAQPVAEQRRQFLQAQFAAWEKQVAAKCVHWSPLEPLKFSRNYGGSITKLDDNSLLFTGDNYYRDQYDLEFNTPLKNITAIRVEVLPHPALPNGGPGRNPNGGYLLSELNASAAPLDKPDALNPLVLQNATADYGTAPQNAI
ncbi:MAG: DUF1549 domain-containing protein, partial [Abitibacteriaceae bacterium]|nr:DUF1549 domain-containing protein [Abditibacteriaceae bacterium]